MFIPVRGRLAGIVTLIMNVLNSFFWRGGGLTLIAITPRVVHIASITGRFTATGDVSQVLEEVCAGKSV